MTIQLSDPIALMLAASAAFEVVGVGAAAYRLGVHQPSNTLSSSAS